jgi:hypothetical protein
MANEAKFKQHLVELQSQKATLREIFGTGEGDNELFEDMFQSYLNSVKWLDSNGQSFFNEVKDQEMIQRVLEELKGGSKLKNEFQLEFKRGKVTLKKFARDMLKVFEDIESNLRNQSSANAASQGGLRQNSNLSSANRQGGPAQTFGGTGIMIGGNSYLTPPYPSYGQQEQSRTPTMGPGSQQRVPNSYENSMLPADGYYNEFPEPHSRVQDSQSQSQYLNRPNSKYQQVELKPEPIDSEASVFGRLPQPSPAISQPYPSSRIPGNQPSEYTASLALQKIQTPAPVSSSQLSYNPNKGSKMNRSVHEIVAEAEQEIFKRMKDTQDRLESVRKDIFVTEHLEAQLREQLRKVKEENMKIELSNKRNEMICNELRPQKESLLQEVEELVDSNERLESQLKQKVRGQQEGVLKQIKGLEAEKDQVSQVSEMLDEENKRVVEQIEGLKSYIKMDTLGQGNPVFTPLFYAQPEDSRYDEKSLELVRLREGLSRKALESTGRREKPEEERRGEVGGALGDIYGYNRHKAYSRDSQSSFSDILEARPTAPVTSLQGKHFSSRFLRS